MFGVRCIVSNTLYIGKEILDLNINKVKAKCSKFEPQNHMTKIM
jgi:hypothetical protein